MRQRWLWTGAGGLAVCGCLALAVATFARAPRQHTFVVQPADVEGSVSAGGVLMPRTQWQLSFGQVLEQQDGRETTVGAASCRAGGADVAGQSLGPVKSVLVQPGESVDAGQVLVEADTGAIKAELDHANQDLADAQALYKQHKDIADAVSSALGGATDGGATAAAATPAAAPTADSAAPAAAPDAGSLKAAALSQLGPDLDRIQHDRRQAAALKALATSADLTAPADAVVQDVYATPGITPTCGTTMVVLRTASLNAHLHLDPDQVKQLQPGQSVRLSVPGTTLATDLTLPTTDPVPEPQPAAQPAPAAGYTIDLPWPDQQTGTALMPGSPVKSSFTVRHDQVLAIPPTAIHLRQNHPYVTVHRCPTSPTDCTEVETPVTEGLTSADRIEITDGLSGGDVVLLPR